MVERACMQNVVIVPSLKGNGSKQCIQKMQHLQNNVCDCVATLATQTYKFTFDIFQKERSCSILNILLSFYHSY